MKVMAVTGYKPMELGIFKMDDSKIVYVKESIKRRLIPWIEDGLEWILISGQAGVESWTAEVIFDLQDTYDIKLAIVPPFLNQESRWPEEQQFRYQEMIERADFYQPIFQKEYENPGQFKMRDKWFLEKSDGCLLLYDEETKGSPHFFLQEAKKYQEKANYPIYFVTPFDIEETVQEMLMESPDYWSNS